MHQSLINQSTNPLAPYLPEKWLLPNQTSEVSNNHPAQQSDLPAHHPILWQKKQPNLEIPRPPLPSMLPDSNIIPPFSGLI